VAKFKVGDLVTANWFPGCPVETVLDVGICSDRRDDDRSRWAGEVLRQYCRPQCGKPVILVARNAVENGAVVEVWYHDNEYDLV
jgi:hypothetical protein